MLDTQMVIISMIAGLLSSMNVWAYDYTHARLHLNDLYMAALMTCWMIALYSLYNGHFQQAIIGFICIIILVYFIRKQTFITESQFMKGMIPHHSMAITMAEQIKNKTHDTKIINFANQIIKAQSEEIKFMQSLGY